MPAGPRTGHQHRPTLKSLRIPSVTRQHVATDRISLNNERVEERGPVSLYDIPLETLAGEPTSLADQRGKALLIVNVASKCGLTPQYTALEQLQKQYQDQAFRSSESIATNSDIKSPAPPTRSRRSAPPPTA
jgi:hypothetical protein